jgi:hypothetical protein
VCAHISRRRRLRISELKSKHADKDVFILGTGPTARLLDVEFFRRRIVIGLNQAWRYFVDRDFAPQYCLTVHPELLQEYLAERQSLRGMKWIVKKKHPMKHLDPRDPDHYVFFTREELAIIRQAYESPVPGHTLYQGRGIQCTALHLAAYMGARAIHLVGVDMNSLGGDHHAHNQHVRFHGLEPNDVYAEYRHWTARVRSEIFKVYGVPVLSVSPLLGEDAGQEEYKRLTEERGLAPLPKPPDTSGYTRKKTDT